MPMTDKFRKILKKKRNKIGDGDQALFEAWKEAISMDLKCEDVFRPRAKRMSMAKFKRQNSSTNLERFDMRY